MNLPKLTLEQVEALIRRQGNQTIYEQARGIFRESTVIVHQSNNLRIYQHIKSDQTLSLQIVFRVGKFSQYWLIWTILDDQAQDMINVFPQIFDAVNEHNRQIWGDRS